MSDATLIEARGVTFAFPGEQPVLRGVDLSVGREVVAVTGASGSGKTTLLMCLAGVYEVDSGSISVAGRRIDGADLEERSQARRELMGLVFQFSELVAELTLAENVALPLELLGHRRRPALVKAQEMLAELDLGGLGGRYPSQVSGGQAQRAAVARALVHEPRVVLADEPTGSLDARNASQVLDLLLDAARRRNAAVVLVTHDASVAASADRIVDVTAVARSATAPTVSGAL